MIELRPVSMIIHGDTTALGAHPGTPSWAALTKIQPSAQTKLAPCRLTMSTPTGSGGGV